MTRTTRLPFLLILVSLPLWAADADADAGAGEPASASPDAWRGHWGQPGDVDEVALETSAANGTLASYKLLFPQYSQKERVAVPGEPQDHWSAGPMEMVTTWDPEFYPFQTRLAGLGRPLDAWRRLRALGDVVVEGGHVPGVERPADARDADRFAVQIGASVFPITAFADDGATLADLGLVTSGTAWLLRAEALDSEGGGARTYRKVAADEHAVTYVWPDPEKVISPLYEERRLRREGAFQLGLEVRIHNLGTTDLPHRLLLRTHGFQDPKGKEAGFMNPVVDAYRGLCATGGDAERGTLQELAEEAQEPPGNVDYAGVESQYFLSVAVPRNLAQTRCVLRGAPYGALEAVIESLHTAVAPARRERCLPGWLTWAPEAERCGVLRARLGVDESLPYLALKKQYYDAKPGLADASVRAWESVLASMKEVIVYDFLLYVGPKDIDVLGELGHELESALDFWIVGILAKPMLHLLRFFHKIIPHWGVAIILLTVLVKLLTWYWSQKSYVQMKEMQKLKPELDALREKFKSDKSRLNQETMNLYKRYKINPLGGCLPMVIQMPIWIALYRTIYSSVELYQAPLFLWIQDLSAPDPWFVLPIIMGASMVLQQRLTPQAGMDEAQAKIMKWMMPIMFTFFMLFLPSGLVLYIFVNTVLSLAQQTWTQRRKDPVPARA